MTPSFTNRSCISNNATMPLQKREIKIGNMFADNRRMKRSAAENIDSPLSMCSTTNLGNDKRSEINCQKLVGDFRYLRKLEFHNLSATPTLANCSQTENLTSYYKPSMEEAIIDEKRISRPGTLLKMLLYQVDQIERKLNEEGGSHEFYQELYSRSVKLLLLSLFRVFLCQPKYN